MAAAPNEKQIRMMHVVNLMSIAFADGEVTNDENDILVNIAQDLGLTEEEFNLCIDHWKQTDEEEIPIAVPESDDEQIEFLKHFTLVMMIDGQIDEKEKEFLAFVADQFGYDPEKVVPALIEDVYQEFFAKDEEDEEEEEEEEEEDPLFEDTDDESQLEMGKMELEGRRVEAAFDELFLPALRNDEAFTYFHIIPGIDTRLHRLSEEQLEKVVEAAEKGYPLAYYVLGRYHQVVRPDQESLELAQKLLTTAAEAGLPDAQWALAMMYLYGHLGPVDLDEFNSRIEKAIDSGSMMALRQQLFDTIHGYHGIKPAPKTVIRQLEAFLEQDENGAQYPYMYDLLGDAYRKTGNKDKADQCYEAARDLGYFESGAHRFENRVEGPDRDFYRETLAVLLDFACDEQDPNSFLARALEHAFHYDKEEKEGKKEEWLRKLHEDLDTAYRLGNGDAAYYLGLYHHTGSYGFEKNDQEAWMWFERGQALESGLAFAGMAQMIEEGIHPSNMPDGYLEYCRQCARLRNVGEGQRDEIPTVLIVSPKGHATVCKLEKEEWYRLPALIGANRLAPLRLTALDKVAQQAGLTDHLVAWIDIDAPRKGLESNTVVTAHYPGVVAGDVVFSLADNLYDPMPFYGIDEAKSVASALKAELGNGVLDLAQVDDKRPQIADYSKVNPYANIGYVARIEPDGKAYIVQNSLNVFALCEEEIYDPIRLYSLRDLGDKLGLNHRLTLWTDNSAYRKEMVLYDKYTPNPVASRFFPGPVADNIFVALEDSDYRITLFDDPDQLTEVCAALGAVEVV